MKSSIISRLENRIISQLGKLSPKQDAVHPDDCKMLHSSSSEFFPFNFATFIE